MVFSFGESRSLTQGVRFVQCGECGRNAKPLPVGGNGKRGILVVFESPTMEQVAKQSWFAGGNSSVLRILSQMGLRLSDDLWVTAILPCFGNHSNLKYEPCLSKLQETINTLNPQLIITVGSSAAGAVLRLYNGNHFNDPNYETGQYSGYCVPLCNSSDNTWKCWWAPVQSDAEIDSYGNKGMMEVAYLWMGKHLQCAVEMVSHGRPEPSFDGSKIEMLFDTKQIVEALEQAATFQYVAFDYECNTLHPEHAQAKVLTVSVAMADSDKIHRTVAFPVSSVKVVDAWRTFLKSDSLKIGANIKFEHRWSLVYFKTPVVNWFWDVCVGQRALDCQPGNSGLKFMSFVLFGVIGYDDAVEAYIDSDTGALNRLHTLEPSVLLRYNAYDAILTYLAARRQHEILNLPF